MINKCKKYFAHVPATGFTLIETLMAILVLMIALGGPYTIAEEGLQATLIAKDQDTAIFLAQDAVEYVRWVRDTNELNNDSDWLASLDGTTPSPSWSGTPTLSGSCTATGGCTIDSLANSIIGCGNSTCPTMYYNSTTNGYSTSASGGTGFVRTVTLSSVAGNTGEEAVNVSVTWIDPQPHMVTVREDIFNWQ